MDEQPSRQWVPRQCLSISELLMRRMNTHPASESLFSVIADQNHWPKWVNTHPASEYISSVAQIRMDEHLFRQWVSLQCLSRSEPPTRVDEHLYRQWVPLQCLSSSELLTRMVNAYSVCESLSIVWADQNHWQEHMNTIQFVSPLSSVQADQNHWLEGWTPIQRVSLSLVL